ncbi:hypothetical protein CAEBREN_01327 [Caenorhabditis brenneri]|uniref:Uncharacterized protein n=1 Tax=Caenorhabditis brenneri TaxID=135651 RepID=G0NMV4_CAEBE|nr:hypothetical protein CAEBREN_01327 [Caenorhabditis brenneri]
MSAKDDKPTPHHNYHPIKILGIVLVWTVSLYIALVIIKNYDADLHPKSPEFSRPHLVKNENICKSPECITLAHQLHNWQDISVDPCQDFYQAACGKYNEQNTVEGPRFLKAFEINLNLVTEHLEKNLPTTSKSEQAMRSYFQKCKESKTKNATEEKDEMMRELYQNIQKIGSFPMMNKNWTESDFDLNEMMVNMASTGKTDFGIFELEPTEDSQIIIYPSTYSHAAYNFFFNSGNKIFLKFMKHYAEVNNLDSKDFEPDQKAVTDLAGVEKFLASIREMGKFQISDFFDETIDFEELQELVPSLDFEGRIKSLINPAKKEETWKKVMGKVRVHIPGYFANQTSNLETILKTTPKRVLANYLIMIYIRSEILKIKKVGESHVHCARAAISTLPLAALRVIVRNHFDKENIDIASKMVEEVRQSFIEMIQESDWLNEETKRNAIRKATMMRKMVGYPKELEVPGALDSFFETLVMSPNDSFYKMISTVEKFETEQAIDFVASSLQMLSKKVYFEANASYSPWRNLLTLNIPFIDDPFFDSTYPDYAKIASIGEVLGHEIGHGFDTDGRKLDENGKKRNWWTPEDSAEYDRRARCLVDQYSNYDDPDFGKRLNGSTTIDEIAADIIGINTSWRKKLNLVNEPKIIGFEDYDTDKLFFRLAALNWCKPRSTHSLSEELTYSHPTSSFRVNGIFSNTKSFAEAYNCPVGSPMNPVKKCELF